MALNYHLLSVVAVFFAFNGVTHVLNRAEANRRSG